MNIAEIEKCVEDCIKWGEEAVSKLNAAQQVEYHRLFAFVNATKYQYQQILSMRTEGFISQILDELTTWFSTNRRLAVLQIERDFYSANVPISLMSKYRLNESSLERFEETDLAENQNKISELRLKSHLYSFKIKYCILQQITNYEVEGLPREIYQIIQ